MEGDSDRRRRGLRRQQQEINLEKFNLGDYTTALESGRRAETITSVLYPDDRQLKGKELRLRQEYFFVSATVQDVLARFLQLGLPWRELPAKMAVQVGLAGKVEGS